MHVVSYDLHSDRVDGCVGTIADRLVMARTPHKVQIVIDKVHLVSVLPQIAPCC